MTLNGWLQILFFLLTVFLVTRPLGSYMARVFSGHYTWLDPVARPVERLIYRLARVDETRGMRWTEYAASILLFSVVSMLVLYVMQRLQGLLPFNPQGFGAVAPDLAFNTAASFTTNTNWQAYSGESTMSYFTQMAGLAYHNFVSAAVGIAVAVAFIRGIAQTEKETIGNFWVDMVRATIWVLLPIAIVGALVLVSQGVVQNLKEYDTVQTVEGAKQVIAQGPVASQEIIKQFGTNGGGFFNANSAHPFENPTPLTNFLAMFGILAISSGLTYTLGTMTGSRRHGWAVWAAMAFLFLAGVTVAYWAEARGNPLLTAALFANFAEAMAEGRGKAQADTLRKAKSETVAHRERSDRSLENVPAPTLRKGDVVCVSAGELIPADGEIIEGVASVDESAITGESAPVIRESGGDRSAVTGGTRVLSDWIRIRITANPGETFLDRMIALVEGAERQKTPNEIALNILLAGLTIVFLIAVVTLQPFAVYSGAPQSLFVLIALLVCLIPTTIGGLLSAIGIAGMDPPRSIGPPWFRQGATRAAPHRPAWTR